MTSSPIIIHNGIAYSIEDKIPKELVEILLNRFSSIREPPISNLSHIYTLKDFENAAFEKLKPETWAYYRTGADDEITLRENVAAFQRVFFRPRILQNVAQVDQSTMFFSTETSSPFYISAFAGSKLGHEYAEKNFSWAANKTGIVQMIPLMSKYPFDEIADELDERDAWLQIYIDSNREVADALINRAIVRGIKAIFFTVDSAQIGNREFESRLNGTTFKQRLLHDPSLTWDDIAAYKKS